MMTDRELMQKAMDAISLAMSSHDVMLTSDPPQDAWKARGVQTKLTEAFNRLRDRLAQPEPEQVDWEGIAADQAMTIAMMKLGSNLEEVPCKTHPDAPHGFDRNASISEDRYVCECESWEPPHEPYDQTALELCDVCGWKTVMPEEGCLNCKRLAQPEHVHAIDMSEKRVHISDKHRHEEKNT
jgi:hypothetical protein